MENGETVEESDTCVRLERDGSSEMVEAGKGDMVVNGDPIETVNPGLLTKKRMDEYLTTLNGNENDSILLAIRISDGLCYGIMKGNDAMVHLFSGDRFVKVDMVAKAIQIWKGNGWEEISHDKGVIDLDVNGRRWEGGVRGDAPFGYGVLYDGDGRREFEGFMMDGVKSCYGIESYPDISRVKYDGCYYNDQRFGMGILYDRNGVVEHNGLWKNDKPYSSEFDGAMMDSRTESIILSEHSFNEVESFVFPPFLGSLKRIDIGDDCFGSIRSLKLTGLIELESVKIGKRCFTHATSETQMFVEMGSDGTFEITDCPNLKSLQIGDFSFADYHLLELEILPSLQQVVVGSHAFHWSYLFSLSGTAACFFTGRAS